ncbi:cytokinin riboside 5'-monophosphate phosphoribohydrolase LOG7-like [Senna tora]|uniref:Cytokinin riboside 5'-monophosphate phosphoribohydrolase LOG7-like n=1 Tax=Senna tora TaxID=362788 RepID=A0A834T1M3_9FABA|nr:cytokinin riboside 5'-monophosphate phosphoribohydrolase LOG7-like [Senna tora]
MFIGEYGVFQRQDDEAALISFFYFYSQANGNGFGKHHQDSHLRLDLLPRLGCRKMGSTLSSCCRYTTWEGAVDDGNINLFKLKVERRIDLVYGGGSVGRMGLVSRAVHDGGRHVLGLFSLIPFRWRKELCEHTQSHNIETGMVTPVLSSTTDDNAMGGDGRKYAGEEN